MLKTSLMTLIFFVVLSSSYSYAYMRTGTGEYLNYAEIIVTDSSTGRPIRGAKIECNSKSGFSSKYTDSNDKADCSASKNESNSITVTIQADGFQGMELHDVLLQSDGPKNYVKLKRQ